MIDPKVVNDTKVIFGPCRLSYTHVFEKYSPDGDGEGKFMTNVLIPKSEKKTIEAIKKAIEAAKKAAIVAKWEAKSLRNLIWLCVTATKRTMRFTKTTSI